MFAVCYRPPDGNVTTFFEFFHTFLSFVNESNYNIICGGDLNINMLVDSATKRDMITIMNENCCVNTVSAPTRVRSESETLIDLFITNFDKPLKYGVTSCDISDHLPIFLCVETTLPKIAKKNCEVYFQPITLDKLDAFRQCISNADRSAVYLKNDADDAYDAFVNEFKHLTSKLLKVSKNARKPWVTKDLLCQINHKDLLYKRFLRTREPENLRIFKAYCNNLTKELRRARTRYYNALFKSSEGRSDIMWKNLNMLLYRNRSSGSVDELTLNGEKLTGGLLADVFNEFFIKFGNTPTNLNAYRHIDQSNANSIFLDPVVPMVVQLTPTIFRFAR